MSKRPSSKGLRLKTVTLCCLSLLIALVLSWSTRGAKTQQIAAASATFSNTSAIVIADADAGGPGVGSLYPSPIAVSGLSGTITSLTVTLNGAKVDPIGSQIVDTTTNQALVLVAVNKNGQTSRSQAECRFHPRR